MKHPQHASRVDSSGNSLVLGARACRLGAGRPIFSNVSIRGNFLVVNLPKSPVLEQSPTGPWKYLVQITRRYLTLRLPTRDQVGRSLTKSGSTSFRVKVALNQQELVQVAAMVGPVARTLTLHRVSKKAICFRILKEKVSGQQDKGRDERSQGRQDRRSLTSEGTHECKA